MDKRALSEIDICDLFITPAIKQAQWDAITQIRREVTLTPGPIVVRGNVASRNKKKCKFADYVLYKEAGVPVVEAKDNNHTVSQGLQQALGYAEILGVPSAFSSNGDAFGSHNMVCAPGEDNRRVVITSRRAALKGYQKGRCFYCFREIALEADRHLLPDVDHLFPWRRRQLGHRGLDGIWNLVLACQECNRGKNGKSDRLPSLAILHRLHAGGPKQCLGG